MKIIIIGLGLIGGSIAKALSSSQDYEILAFDSNQNSIKNALDNQSIQGSLHSPVSYTHLTLPTIYSV